MQHITLLCGRNCQALWSACLSFLVSPASRLVRIGRGRAHTGSVHEWVGVSPHAPCGYVHLLWPAHSPLSLDPALHSAHISKSDDVDNACAKMHAFWHQRLPCKSSQRSPCAPARKTPDGRATSLGASLSCGALYVMCAAGFLTRGAFSPQTTCSPCRRRCRPAPNPVGALRRLEKHSGARPPPTTRFASRTRFALIGFQGRGI
jgi:hypothetical protein